MEARLKKEAEQREREARQQEEQRRRIANEQKKARKPLNDMPPIREVHHHEPAVQRCKSEGGFYLFIFPTVLYSKISKVNGV